MGGALEAYRTRRRFKGTSGGKPGGTPEPRGRVSRSKGRLVYTIQKHAARRLHYDLRLELDGVLKSWAVTRGPSLDPADKRLAVRVEDHPLDYATFEGTIPEGNYGAGSVLLWDKGSWEPIGDPHAGLASGKLVFQLHGERLRGRWALVRFHGKHDPRRENWLLIKEKDDEAERGQDASTIATTSVASGREIEAVSAKPPRHQGKPPAFIDPQLATLADTLPKGDNWLFEVKLDGYRALTAAAGGDVRIYTRSGNDWTDRYPSVESAIASLDLDRALLDGEVVAVDKEGRSNFGALQQALSEGKGDLTYFVFDLLALAGEDLRGKPLIERKKRLRKLLNGVPRNGPLAFSDHIEADGGILYQTLCEKHFEGVIAKRADAPYRSGRGQAWLKIKCHQEQEFVIVGWSGSTAERPFASVLLAQYVDGALRYAGRAGSGFDRRDLDNLARRFKKLARRKSPLDNKPPPEILRDAHWLRPELVVRIAFAEFTGDGIVRQARFTGLREDKPAHSVEPEKAMATPILTDVRLTHPEKVLFPKQGLTKQDLASYLAKMADRMLPYLVDRPISLLRYPDGLGHPGFFQRHPGAGLPKAIHPLPVKDAEGEATTYLSISDQAGLLSAAQFDVLEFHIWGTHIDDVDRPDRIVFDLDPDPAVDFAQVREAAADLRAALDALRLKSFALLSGGKGVHIVVPVVRRHPWPVIKQFAKALSEKFAQEAPDRFVATMSKARRKGRIFIDHFRNERTASAVAPYSPRARDNASVAWPVTWPDLAKTDSADAVTMTTALQRLAAPDPWHDYHETRQNLTAAALRALKVAP